MSNDKKKTAEEASNTFHNIMKASVTSNHPQVETCPECSLLGQFIPPAKRIGRTLIVTFKCPNEHIFIKEVELK